MTWPVNLLYKIILLLSTAICIIVIECALVVFGNDRAPRCDFG
jgi:hypothetical protein